MEGENSLPLGEFVRLAALAIAVGAPARWLTSTLSKDPPSGEPNCGRSMAR